jgi:uncharacterized membrane protein
MPGTNDSSWVGAIMVSSILAIAATSVAMPERIATHFDGAGVANGFMTRIPYLILMGVVAVAIPVLVLQGLRSAVRRAMGNINIPNREYWLSPQRREASIAWVFAHAARLAAGVSAFAFGLHVALIRANSFVPPKLEPAIAMLLLASSLGGVLIWAFCLLRHFRRP